jgi:lipopolysaccharide/colanic/teichoic acid biosynthesis glycosyltransferase
MQNTHCSDEIFIENPTEVPPWKRPLDVFLILLTAPLWAPVFLLVALLIRSVSKGPILFRQVRVGHLGRRFTCYKFRTMHVGNDVTCHQEHLARLMQSDVPMVKMDAAGDPRIIPCGGILRATGLDELPQLLNVLFGDMSLVGPRPCLPYEYDKYLDWQKDRFNALPGLTGLWQVSGKNKTTFNEMIQLDIQYAQNQKLSRDLIIIARTIPALVGQVSETRKPAQSPLRVAQINSIVKPLGPDARLMESRYILSALARTQKIR